MNINTLQRETKEETITIRLYKKDKEFLINNKISATKLFEQALEEIKNKINK